MVTRLQPPSQLDDLPTENTEEGPEDESIDLNYEIASYPADYTLRVLNEQIKEGQLVLPDFQRGYVWKPLQASRLIESFLLGLPVPEVFLYKERATEQRLVVDGQQRLATIAFFYKERFANDNIFRLRGVDARWEGKTYADLNEPDKLRFDNSTLRSIVIQQLHPDDHSSIYTTFERLNTGGTQLNPMEIRRVQFPRVAFGYLDSLNADGNWRELIGILNPHPRLKDIELVLRVLALASDRAAYKRPLKAFLNEFMRKLEGMDRERLEALRGTFEDACKIAHDRLPRRPFHIRGPLNMAALDAVLGVLMHESHRVPSDLEGRFGDLVSDESFLHATDSRTSDEDSVNLRYTRALNVLVD